GCFPHDGKTVLTMAGRFEAYQEQGKRWRISLWDVNTGKELRRLQGPNEVPPQFMTLTPDGKALAWQHTGQIHFWDLDKDQSRKPLGPQEERHSFGTVIFSKDSKWAAVRDEKAVRLWSLADAELVAWFGVLPVQRGQVDRGAFRRGAVLSLAFSEDSKKLVASAEGERLRMWDLEDQKEIQPAPWHRGAVIAGRILPGG